MSLILFIGGITALAIWLSKNFPPLYVWLGAVSVVVGVIGLSFMPYYKRAKASPIDIKKQPKLEVGEAIIEPSGIITVNIKPIKKMKLTKISLGCNGKSVDGIIQGNVQLPCFIKKGVNYSVEFNFFKDVNYAKAWEIEEKERFAYRQGRRNEFYLEVTANVGVWKSHNFPIPTKIEEPPFVLQYSMSKNGELTIEKDAQNFYIMALPITLKFTNLDIHNSISVFPYPRISVDIFLQDDSKSPYMLDPQTNPEIKLEPEQKDREQEYLLRTSAQFAEPKFKDKAHCQWSEMGHAWTQNYGQFVLNPLEPFDVKVSYKEG